MEQFTAALNEGTATVARVIPQLVSFLLILLIGFIVAKVLRSVTDKVLERVGFDRAVERGGVKQALAKSEYDASSLVAQVVFYAVVLFALQMAFGVFGPNPISDLLQGLISFLPNIVVAIVLIVVAAAVGQAVRSILQSTIGGLSYGPFVAKAAGIAILGIGVFAALDQLRIAPNIVNGVFYAILAIIAGSAIVAIGGSGIQPLRSRWEQALSRMDDEADTIKAEVSDSNGKADSGPATPATSGNGRPTERSGRERTITMPEHASTGTVPPPAR